MSAVIWSAVAYVATSTLVPSCWQLPASLGPIADGSGVHAVQVNPLASNAVAI